MSNSKRWREFITWFQDIDLNTYEGRDDLYRGIELKIEKIKRKFPDEPLFPPLSKQDEAGESMVRG